MRQKKGLCARQYWHHHHPLSTGLPPQAQTWIMLELEEAENEVTEGLRVEGGQLLLGLGHHATKEGLGGQVQELGEGGDGVGDIEPGEVVELPVHLPDEKGHELGGGLVPQRGQPLDGAREGAGGEIVELPHGAGGEDFEKGLAGVVPELGEASNDAHETYGLEVHEAVGDHLSEERHELEPWLVAVQVDKGAHDVREGVGVKAMVVPAEVGGGSLRRRQRKRLQRAPSHLVSKTP